MAVIFVEVALFQVELYYRRTKDAYPGIQFAPQICPVYTKECIRSRASGETNYTTNPHLQHHGSSRGATAISTTLFTTPHCSTFGTRCTTPGHSRALCPNECLVKRIRNCFFRLVASSTPTNTDTGQYGQQFPRQSCSAYFAPRTGQRSTYCHLQTVSPIHRLCQAQRCNKTHPTQ